MKNVRLVDEAVVVAVAVAVTEIGVRFILRLLTGVGAVCSGPSAIC